MHHLGVLGVSNDAPWLASGNIIFAGTWPDLLNLAPQTFMDMNMCLFCVHISSRTQLCLLFCFYILSAHMHVIIVSNGPNSTWQLIGQIQALLMLPHFLDILPHVCVKCEECLIVETNRKG